jgi:bacteriocin biosynthesis cyclodehydratase domain-containing protein
MTASRQVGLVAGADPFSRTLTRALADGIAARGWRAQPSDLGTGLDGLDVERLLIGADVTVVVLDRHDPALLDRFDRASHGTLRPWLSITVRHPYVQVGPYVAPFRGACQQCLRMRLKQHGRLDPVADRSAGTPAGWARGLPPHTAVIAAGAALALLSAGPPDDRRDDMVLLHTDGMPVFRVPVVGVHLCPRCGDRSGGRPSARDNARIRAALASARPAR